MVTVRQFVRITFVLGALVGSFWITSLFLGSDPDSGLFILPVFAVIGSVAVLLAMVLGAWATRVPTNVGTEERFLLIRTTIVLLLLASMAAILTAQ
jgi:hypothetical protein